MTALSATPVAPTGTTPPSIRLNVTAAPNPPTTAYTSSFTAGVDGWVAGAGGEVISNDTGTTPASLYLRKAYPAVANTAYTASRTVTGLTIGVTYRYRAQVAKVDSGQVRLSVLGSTTGQWVATSYPVTKAFTEITFTATATSHTIRVQVQWTGSPLGAAPGYKVDTITVAPISGWLGTRLLRTDANGVNVPVRLSPGQDTAGGTMTVWDFEAALYGMVSYTVVDGIGGTAAAATSHAIAAGMRLNLLRNPLGPTGLVSTPWTASRATMSFAGSYLRLTITDALVGAVAQRLQWGTTLPVAGVAGSVYTAQALMRTNTAAAGQAMLVWFDGAGAVISTILGPVSSPLNDTTDTLVSITATAPAGTATIGLYFGLDGVGARAIGQWFEVRQAMIEQTAELRPWFDGYTVDPDGVYVYAWQAAAVASASYRLDPRLAPLPWLSTPGFDVIPSAGTGSGAPVPSVLNYSEQLERTGELVTVINRRDPVGNPGVMTLRAGVLSLWFGDYADAVTARRVLERGQTVQLRQPDFPGLDLYLSVARVKLEPASLDTRVIRWQVTVDYEEVLAP